MTTSRHYLRRTPPPISHVAADSWRDLAACANHPTLGPHMWDDSLHGENNHQRAARVARAKAVCAECPVAAACFEDVDRRWDEGIRAGIDLRQLYRRGRAAS